MPTVGEIRKGKEIGKNGYASGANFIWRSCIDCGKEEWVASRKGQPTRKRCKACRGKQIWRVRHMKEDPQPKGTISQPHIGDIRRADEVGVNTSPAHRCIYVQCSICKQYRWRLLENHKVSLQHGTNDLCLSCSKKRTGFQIANWNGGTSHNDHGYHTITLRPDSPFYPMMPKGARHRYGGYILEHRLVMAKHLGRCLHSWEVVHHKNHIRDDNRIENLELLPRARHEGFTQLENRISNLENEMRKQSQLIRLLLWHIAELNKT